ncbi:cytochrome P450 [Longimycelium tulufanense]|uniref:Cytochrome P450 n=1 Tax=Longimycelium tulufanense TaxID=907463 RepID=A0A8J3CEF7_9PSEU|nr:cytochrome P450 [Longimycelium tulufanense]GGM54553.1 cytochrome P450 [Longimycelium tulufanense]
MTSELIPGPRALPLLGFRGNLAMFLRDAISYLQQLHERYGEVASLARGTADYVVVFSPRYNQLVLANSDLFRNLDAASSPLRMPEGSSLSRLYAGLTNMNGARHRRHRKLVAAALRRRHVEKYATDIVRLAEQHVARWKVDARIDILTEMRALTMAIAIKTLLGLEPDRAGTQVSRLLQDWMDSVFSVPAISFPVNLPNFPYRRLLELSEQLERDVRAVIARRRSSGPGGTDALSRLMHAEEDEAPLTDDELVGQTTFLFMAGHATTASSLAWTLLLLSTHPGILRDVLDEVDGVLGHGTPDASTLPALPLLERVIKESLRLFPPVAWWSKVSMEDTELGPYRLMQDAHVIFSPYVTHRRPELYPRPNRFHPDRWLTGNRDPFEYLPFSAGPRMCLGSGLAMMEMKLVLAVLLHHWRLVLYPRLRVDRGGLMVSQPKHGLPALVRSRCEPVRAVEILGNVRRMVDLG